jgi:predicted dehydrogenase
MVETYTSQGIGFPDVAGAPELYGKPVGFAVAAIEHFIECVVNDSPPRVTGEDGLSAAKVVAAIEHSARTGQPVELH